MLEIGKRAEKDVSLEETAVTDTGRASDIGEIEGLFSQVHL